MKFKLMFGLAVALWAMPVAALDNFKNFAVADVSIGYNASATSIVLSTGGAARMPTPPFNAIWWNASTYSDPSDDPNREVVRVTAIASETLTVTRAQESTSATTKNTAGKRYKMMATLTAKTLNTDLASIGGGATNFTGQVTGSGTGTVALTIAANTVTSGNLATLTNGYTLGASSLSGTTPSWNWSTERSKTLTLTGNTTLTVSSVPSAGDARFELEVVGNGSYSFALSGPTIQWPEGTAPSVLPSATNTFFFKVIGGAVRGYYSTPITTSSALRAALTDEVGSGAAMFTRTGVRRTVFIGAGAMIPRTTAGAAPTTTELATTKVMLDTMDFDSSTEENVGFWIAMPATWDLGTLTFKFFWTATSGSGNVKWDIQGRGYVDDDAIDQPGGTEQTSGTDTFIGANEMHVTSTTSALTLAGNLAAGSPVYFRIARDVGTDTLNADAKLIGVQMEYTESATEPSAQ